MSQKVRNNTIIFMNTMATVALIIILAIGFVMTFSGKFKLGYLESAIVCTLFVVFYLLFLVSINYANLKFKYQKNKSYLNTVKSNCVDLVYEKNLNSEIVDCNNALEKLFGKTREEIIGKKVSDFFDSEKNAKILVADEKIIKTKKSVKYTISYINPNGEEIIYDVAQSPIFDDKNNVIGIVGVCRDITDQTKWEKDRRTFNETLAHDIKTPIIAQTKILELLLGEKMGTLNIEQKELIKHTISSNNFAKEMVMAMLSTYKFSNNSYRFMPENVEIKSFVNQIVEDLKPASYSKDLSFEIDDKDLKDEIIVADDLSLQRVMVNLLFNAISYSSEKTPIRVILSSNDGKFEFKIENFSQKTSMTKQSLLEMFERYSFGKKQNKQIGSGIGLFLAKCIINHYDGQIVYDVIKNDERYDKYVLGFEIPVDNSKIENKLFKFDY